MTTLLKDDASTGSLGTLAKQFVSALLNHNSDSSGAGMKAAGRDLPPVLLTMPNNHGTLAAARSLGRAGVRVVAADPGALSITSWSKYTTTQLRCPMVRRSAEFLDWLIDFGRRSERHVLLATCDDTVWLYAKYREQLSPYFHVPQLDVEVLHRLLNKRLMSEQAHIAGLDVPKTWFPADDKELNEVARIVRFPVLLKPVTQAFFLPRHKGFNVTNAEELLREYKILCTHPYGKDVKDYDASVTRPMVQEFYGDASAKGIYSISGYVRGGRVLNPLASRKVLQWPRRLGVGVCFEEAKLDEKLVEGVTRLANQVGFSGTFEAEFVQDAERRLLIDFNPRFYNQMAFDIARGSPLPLLAYEDATGRDLGAAAIGARNGAKPRIYVHGSAAGLMLGSQGLSGAMKATELSTWRNWYDRHRGERIDAVHDSEDRAPALLDAALLLKACMRHPQHFFKNIVRNR